MRALYVARAIPFLLLCAACPPDRPARAPLPEGQEGEPCAIGDRVVRQCGFGLACIERPAAPMDPNERQVVSAEGGGCGGVAGIQCLPGLACDIAPDDVMQADAMGKCASESFCAHPEPAPAPSEGQATPE